MSTVAVFGNSELRVVYPVTLDGLPNIDEIIELWTQIASRVETNLKNDLPRELAATSFCGRLAWYVKLIEGQRLTTTVEWEETGLNGVGGELVSFIDGVIISKHQVEPGNIGGYARMISDTLIRRSFLGEAAVPQRG